MGPGCHSKPGLEVFAHLPQPRPVGDPRDELQSRTRWREADGSLSSNDLQRNACTGPGAVHPGDHHTETRILHPAQFVTEAKVEHTLGTTEGKCIDDTTRSQLCGPWSFGYPNDDVPG